MSEIVAKNTPEIAQVKVQTVTLDEKLALALHRAILSETKFRDSKNHTCTVRIPKEDGSEEVVTFSSRTLDSWLARGSKVQGMEVTLRALFEDAREKLRKIKEKKADEERKRISERALDDLLAMPIHNTSVMRVLKRDKGGKMREVQRTTIHDISAPLVHAKVKGLTFALERLAPEKYGKREEVKHAHVIFSLADLRKHKELKNESRPQRVEAQQ